MSDLEQRLRQGQEGCDYCHESEEGEKARLEAADRIAQLEAENQRVREIWDAIFDLGSTFGGGRQYNAWVRLSMEMQRTLHPEETP